MLKKRGKMPFSLMNGSGTDHNMPDNSPQNLGSLSEIAKKKLSLVGYHHFSISVEGIFTQLLRYDPSLRAAEIYDPVRINDILHGHVSPLYPEDHPWCGAICLHAQAIAMTLGMNVEEVFTQSALDPNTAGHSNDEFDDLVERTTLDIMSKPHFDRLSDPERHVDHHLSPNIKEIIGAALATPHYSSTHGFRMLTEEEIRAFQAALDLTQQTSDDDVDRVFNKLKTAKNTRGAFLHVCRLLGDARKYGPNSPLFIYQ